MEHIAIDLGGRKSQICVRREDGEIVEEKKVPTDALPRYLSWRFQHNGKARVIVETCAEAFWVANAAGTIGHEARIVPGTLAPSLGVGARRNKSDTRDARALSLASCRMDLGSVHIPSDSARELKTFCGMRDALINSRTMLINTVRGWLRGQVILMASGTTATFVERVRREANSRELTLPVALRRQLEAIDVLSKQIADADEELDTMAERDPVCRRLMTMPGVGPVTAVRFRAAIDDIGRFRSAHALESYLGLVPGENSSSEKQCSLSITKAGSAHVRRTLVQASWAARQCRVKQPMVLWADQIALRRGKKVSAVALARKMAGILFAMWRDQADYNSTKGSNFREQGQALAA